MAELVYYDWMEQPTDTLRLARLRQYISELSRKMGPDVSSGGMSINRASLQAELRDLRALIPTYERAASLEQGGLVIKPVIRRPEDRGLGGGVCGCGGGCGCCC